MTLRRACFTTVALGLLLATLPSSAQLRTLPVSEESGYTGLGLLLRRLSTVGVFMQATAHPDDESNALLTMLTRGKGYRAIVVSATRGDGGQNEIGPELFDALGVLRTEELLAVHRFDGAEQYFTRAVDFGYSFSVEETFEKWGRDEIVGDYVRLIRTLRPDVILGLLPEGAGGGQHHQASGVLSREAFKAAADPTKYPEQIRDGLRPWQAKKFYYNAGFGPEGRNAAPGRIRLTSFETAVYDPLLGRTYSEVGTEGRSMHKCQGMAQLLALPGPAVVRFNLMDSVVPVSSGEEESLFDGIDTTIRGLVQYAQESVPSALTEQLNTIARHAENAQSLFASGGPFAAAPALVAGLTAVRTLRETLGLMGLSDNARFEIDTRLKAKEDEFSEAAVMAHGLRLEALADDGIIVSGQPVKVSVLVADRGPHEVAVKSVAFAGFNGEAACGPGPVKTGGVFGCDAGLRVPTNVVPTRPYWKRLPNAARYEFEPDAPFGLPFRPTPFQARLNLTLSGTDVPVVLPVEYRYEGNIFSGEKRMELTVVPQFAVTMTPEIAIIPLGRTTRATTAPAAIADREVRVTVTNNGKGQATGEVALQAPAGLRVTPPVASVDFRREDEAQTVRFAIRAAPGTSPGQYPVKAVVRSAGASFDRGYEVVEYPHIHRRQLEIPAVTTLKVIDVRTAPNLLVGYIMGVGDQVPPAIEQLGAKVEMIEPDELAWGNLGRYDAIVTGVRAYERRADLRAHNNRLIEYAQNGGTVIVQYNKFEFNQAQYGPYPAKVGSNRVTDENAPVQVLDADHPVFHFPNEIGSAAWQGWVQERGLYFLGERDPRYVDLLQLNEPFEYNKGWKQGALVEARAGKGRWIYVGLGLWRQLPAGTDGAYQLLANLISLGKAPARPASGSAAK